MLRTPSIKETVAKPYSRVATDAPLLFPERPNAPQVGQHNEISATR